MDIILLCVFPVMVAFGATIDLVTMTIPNRLSLLMIGTFIIVALLTQMPLHVFGLHLLAGFMMLVITFGCFACGWCGGGDAKLAAAVALWFGFSDILDYILVSGMLGGGLTLALVYWRTLAMPEALMKINWISRLHHSKTGIPYGIALGLAALVVYPESVIWKTMAQIKV